MSNGNVWQTLFAKYAGTNFQILPGADGEPWVSYQIVAELLGKEAETISKMVTKYRIRRHPVFSGMIKISAFESLEAGNGES